MKTNSPFKVLCLDGGGAKGVYTLGFLRALESELGTPCSKLFDAIYGTSTGAIIASLLGLGKSADEALALYFEYVPSILKPRRPSKKSEALAAAANKLFGTRTFSDFQTFVGIVATNWGAERPLIFKSSVQAAHGLQGSFVAGFGTTIAKAVQASCSASPFFDKCVLDLGAAGTVEVRDGGFSANNPSLFAIVDALKSCPPENIRLLSVGVGLYPEPKRSILSRLLRRIPTAHLLQKTLSINANTTEKLVTLLCDKIMHLRINDTFESPEMATDFLECNKAKLELLVQKGRDSFGNKQSELLKLLKTP